MEELWQGLMTCIIQRVWFPSLMLVTGSRSLACTWCGEVSRGAEQRSSPKPLKRQPLWSGHLAGAHERQAFDQAGRVALAGTQKRRRVQWHCPRAPTPEPGKGRRPKNRQSQRRKVFLPGCPVSFLSWPACCRGFPGSGSLVLRPLSLRVPCLVFVPPDVSFLLAAGVTFQLPAGGTSGQAQGHRPEEPALSRYPSLRGICLTFSLRCSRWICTGLFSSTRTYVSLTTATNVGHVFSLGFSSISSSFSSSHFF